MKALLGGMIVAAFVFIACSGGDAPCGRDENSYEHSVRVEGYELRGVWEFFTDEPLIQGDDSLTLTSTCLQQESRGFALSKNFDSDWLESITLDLADDNLEVTVIR